LFKNGGDEGLGFGPDSLDKNGGDEGLVWRLGWVAGLRCSLGYSPFGAVPDAVSRIALGDEILLMK
jgi:hypothetical protein